LVVVASDCPDHQVPTDPPPVDGAMVDRVEGDEVGVDRVVGDEVGVDRVVGDEVGVDGVGLVRLVGAVVVDALLVVLPVLESGRVAVTVTVRTEVRVTVTVEPLGNDASMRSSRQAR